jgi:putative transposase
VPRKPRLHVSGGLYHVILRGNGRQAIFFDDDDRIRWMRFLQTGLERYQDEVHAYCWMTNHVHMAIRSASRPLSELMRFTAAQYARQTNRKMGRSGHLFERRYRAILVDADNYLLALIRYIHLNPVRAGLARGPRDYPWSSHRAYLGNHSTEWLSTDWVLSQFGGSRPKSRLAYARFMASSDHWEVPEELKTGVADDERLAGDEHFVQAVANMAPVGPRKRSLDQIISDCCQQHTVTEVELAAPRRTRATARLRAIVAVQAIEERAASLAEVARRFKRSDAALSQAITRLKATCKTNS